MTKLRVWMATSIAAVVVSTAAHSQDVAGFYFNAAFGSVEVDNGIESIRTTNVILRPGYSFNRYFDVEGEVSLTLGKDSIEDGGIVVDFSTTTFGVFGKANLPVSDVFSAFARVGWVSGEITGEALGVSVSFDDDAFAYGIGFDYWVLPNAAVRFDATWSEFEDFGETADTTSLGLGITWRY